MMYMYTRAGCVELLLQFELVIMDVSGAEVISVSPVAAATNRTCRHPQLAAELHGGEGKQFVRPGTSLLISSVEA